MTLGDKIRKYRLLNNKKQAELGAEYETEMQMIDKEVTITYYIPEEAFKLRQIIVRAV